MRSFTKTVNELDSLANDCKDNIEDLSAKSRDIESRIIVEEHELRRAEKVSTKLKELIGE